MKTITLSDEDWGNVLWLAECGEDDKTYHIQNYPEDYGNEQEAAEAGRQLDEALHSLRKLQEKVRTS